MFVVRRQFVGACVVASSALPVSDSKCDATTVAGSVIAGTALLLWRNRRERDAFAVVDCGSGHSTWRTYATRAASGAAREVHAVRGCRSLTSRATTAAAAGSTRPAAARRRPEPIRVGATAGAREALRGPAATRRARLCRVWRAARARGAGRARACSTAPGGRRRVARRATPAARASASSPAGASVQVAPLGRGRGHAPNRRGRARGRDRRPAPPRLRSIASDSFAGQAPSRSRARAWAPRWAWRCQSAVAALRPGARAGQYVCIEMVAWIAERAGLPVGESVTQPAVIAALAALAARRAGELAGARGADGTRATRASSSSCTPCRRACCSSSRRGAGDVRVRARVADARRSDGQGELGV